MEKFNFTIRRAIKYIGHIEGVEFDTSTLPNGRYESEEDKIRSSEKLLIVANWLIYKDRYHDAWNVLWSTARLLKSAGHKSYFGVSKRAMQFYLINHYISSDNYLWEVSYQSCKNGCSRCDHYVASKFDLLSQIYNPSAPLFDCDNHICCAIPDFNLKRDIDGRPMKLPIYEKQAIIEHIELIKKELGL